MLQNKLEIGFLDCLGEHCFVSDVETYELKYINPSLRKALNIADDFELKGHLCYNLIYNKSEPCEKCSSKTCGVGERVNRIDCDEDKGTCTSVTNRIIVIDGKKYNLHTLEDVTEKLKSIKELERRSKVDAALLSCAQTLSQTDEFDKAINNILAIIGEFYGAERAHVYEIQPRRTSFVNTFEWCADIENPYKHSGQKLPDDITKLLCEEFLLNRQILFVGVDCLTENSVAKNILEAYKIKDFLLSPLISNNTVLGFIGVDNPDLTDIDKTLIASATNFVLDDLLKRRLQSQLERLSYIDALTGVYNRNKFMHYIEDLEVNPPDCLGILYADINGLKPANDTYGHDYGDSLIVRTAEMLTNNFGKYVYRIGGDEFVALAPNIDEASFESSVENFSLESEVDKVLSISIGYTWKKGHFDLLKEIEHSDNLMYAEKQNYYRTALPSKMSYKSAIEADLIDDISKGVFDVYLQAKVELSTGKIKGAEALVRKFDATGKAVSPENFINNYEKEGVIKHVDFFVFETVCKTLRKWIDDGHPMNISVNISKITFLEQYVIKQLRAICEKYEIPPQYIEIEITESTGRTNAELLSRKISEANKRGFSIALDDFGSQYSNLLLLSSMEFSQVKIDKSLIDKICKDEKNMHIIQHALSMCRSLSSMQTIAEGVETEEQRAMLDSFDCDLGQGYLFSKPLPINEFLKVYLEQLDSKDTPNSFE